MYLTEKISGFNDTILRWHSFNIETHITKEGFYNNNDFNERKPLIIRNYVWDCVDSGKAYKKWFMSINIL